MKRLPNALTWLRIAMIPVFVVLFLLPAEWLWARPAAAIVFSIAGLTDLLDGYSARRMGTTSKFGAFLDPVADKLLVATALVLLCYDPARPDIGGLGWMVTLAAAIIIGREISISALREWMAELGARHHVAVSRIGKYKTTAQVTALILMIFLRPIYGVNLYLIGFASLMIAAVLTLWSMYVYLRQAWPFLSEEM